MVESNVVNENDTFPVCVLLSGSRLQSSVSISFETHSGSAVGK